MGCGCKKNGGLRNVRRPGMPRVASQSTPGSNSTIQPQQQISAQSVQPPTKSASGLDAERRAVEKRRREAIRRVLGK